MFLGIGKTSYKEIVSQIESSRESETSFLLIEYGVNEDDSSLWRWHDGSNLERLELVKLGNVDYQNIWHGITNKVLRDLLNKSLKYAFVFSFCFSATIYFLALAVSNLQTF